jgi:hypothetical protein
MVKIAGQMQSQGLTVLKPEDSFRFNCHAGLKCFTQCCRDITIFLTPFDILQLKNALGVSSESFLQEYTVKLINDTGLPVVLLKMHNDEEKSCPFVTSRGCSVYPHRPWACRIYPLQPESTKITEKTNKAFFSVMNVPFCLGFFEDNVSTIEAWRASQGIPVYEEMEKIFKNITSNEFLAGKKIENRKIQEMFYMAAYDLDRFRRFIFESTFLDRFEIEPDVSEKIKHDDAALYRFAMKWLEYGLIGQDVLQVKSKAMAAKKHQ